METATPKEVSSRTVYDVEEIRQQARQSLEKGAVTGDYRLDLNQAIQMLNEALATEILCVLRYRHHEIVAKGIDFPQVSAEFAEHAAEEQEHAMWLAERISQLGGDPDMDPKTIGDRSATEYGGSGSLESMIRDNLVAERVAIEVYRKQIEWFGDADPTTRRLLEKILEQEEEHANDLADLLPTAESRSQPAA